MRTTTGDYAATTSINRTALKPGQSAGLSAFGDRENALGASVRDGNIVVWRRSRGKLETLSTNSFATGDIIHLRLTATGGHKFTFSTSTDNRAWKSVGGNLDVEGDYLPPWDRGIRVALVVGGEKTEGEFGPVRVVNSTRQ